MSDPSDNPPHGHGLISVEEVVAACSDARGVVVVGACDAVTPLHYKRLLPEARVLAIEGLPENYQRWLEPEMVRGTIEASCAVIGARVERSDFFVQRTNGLHSIYDRGQAVELRKVDTTTLDHVLRSFGFTHPDIIAIDVEGAAPDVLMGGSWSLARVKAVVVELESEEIFAKQRLADVARKILESHGLVQSITRKYEAESGRFQHEDLWVRP